MEIKLQGRMYGCVSTVSELHQLGTWPLLFKLSNWLLVAPQWIWKDCKQDQPVGAPQDRHLACRLHSN